MQGQDRRLAAVIRPPDAPAISLHRPHPGNIVRMYVIDDVLRLLTEEKLI